jgi:hypothetical protein
VLLSDSTSLKMKVKVACSWAQTRARSDASNGHWSFNFFRFISLSTVGWGETGGWWCDCDVSRMLKMLVLQLIAFMSDICIRGSFLNLSVLLQMCLLAVASFVPLVS